MTKRFIIALLLLLSVPMFLSAQQKNKVPITVNGVSFTMIRVEGGTLILGNAGGNFITDVPEHPETLVTYYIGETEVTVELWKAVMGNIPENNQDTTLFPVRNVTWNDCQDFIKELNRLTGRTFRLPTEAEWEFAARGGVKSHGYLYSGSNNIDVVACYGEKNLCSVKSLQPNELEIYDMSGSVREWCLDKFGSWSDGTPSPCRTLRGGCWKAGASSCTVTIRYPGFPDDKSDCYTYGFRLVLEL